MDNVKLLGIEYLKDYLKNKLKKYLPIEDISEIDESSSLFEQGLTSLKATELQHALANDLKININSTVLFNHPTFNTLIQFLAKQKEIEGFSQSGELYSDFLLTENEEAKKILYEEFGI